jgi:hypothetical protein
MKIHEWAWGRDESANAFFGHGSERALEIWIWRFYGH